MDDTCRKKKETIGSDCIHINLIARAIDSVPPELQIALLLLSHSHSRATDSPSSTSGERPRPARTAPSHTDSSPPASGGDTRRRCGRHKGGRGERTGRGEDLANAFDGTDAVGLEIQNAARSQYQPMFSAALLSKLPPPPLSVVSAARRRRRSHRRGRRFAGQRVGTGVSMPIQLSHRQDGPTGQRERRVRSSSHGPSDYLSAFKL